MGTRPLHDRVVLKRDERQRHSAGGILIPDTAGEKPAEGRVMALGKGKILENGKVRPRDLKAGDRALFGNTAAPRSKSK
jgi:chaperonin GroES